MTFLQYLIDRLQTEGPMPFVGFMQEALYAPGLGYYSSDRQKFGMGGDFITAPELSPLFGKTVAAQCAQVLKHIGHASMFEFGAGSGRLCVDVLRELEALNALPQDYFILELSGELQARQRALLLAEVPHLAARVQWLSQWPTTPFKGVILANEVLDAMPVHRFLQTEQGLLESYIGLSPSQTLQEQFKPCDNLRLQAHVQRVLAAECMPYQSEANLFLEDWFVSCSKMLQEGAFLIFDYGFPRHEYYHPDRRSGTLMCHYQHQVHPDILAYPGEQDITAHVDFTHVAEAAFAAGFHVAGYTNQASFLLANGLLSLMEALHGERERFRAQQALKQLLHPHEMGELFKVIALTKQLDLPLQGFQEHDKRASL